MKLSLVDKFSSVKWNRFILSQSEAFFYHDFRWQKIAQQLGFKPQYFIIQRKDKLFGVLPLFSKKGLIGGIRIVSLPFGESGPLGKNQEKRQLIIKVLDQARKLNAKLEIISPQKIFDLPKQLIQKKDYAYYILKTNSAYEEIFKNSFHKKTRNMIRKADKMGIKITLASEDDLEKFYQLYLKIMKKLGALPFPSRVFIKVWNCFFKETRLLKAVFKGEIIGFLWVFEWNKSAWIWANATEEKYLFLGVNYALYSEAIKRACRNKQIRQVNFGGSEFGSSQEFFKLRWGTKKKSVFLITNSSSNKKLRIQERLRKVINNLPIFLVRMGGELAYKVY